MQCGWAWAYRRPSAGERLAGSVTRGGGGQGTVAIAVIATGHRELCAGVIFAPVTRETLIVTVVTERILDHVIRWTLCLQHTVWAYKKRPS